MGDGLARALRQHRAQAERQVGRSEQLLDGDHEQDGQALAAEFRRGTKLRPAAGDERVVGCLETVRRRDAALRPACAFPVGAGVERVEHTFREAARLLEHGAGKFGGEVRKGFAAGQSIGADDGIEGVVQVVQRRAVHRCGASSTVGRAKRRHCPGPEV